MANSQTLLHDAASWPALANHPTQSAAPIDGWQSVVFGVPFAAAGATILGVAFGVVDLRREAPAWLIGLIGSLFFFGGIFFCLHGVRGVMRRAAYQRDAQQRPDQPWMYDYPWSRDGVMFSPFNEMVRRFMAVLVWNAFLVPFFWIGLNAHGAGVFLVFATLFGLIGLVFAYRWLQMLAELFRYGTSSLQFEAFPYAIGGTLKARLHIRRHLDVIQQLTVTFRCIEERYVTTGAPSHRSTRVVCYERHADVMAIGSERLTASPDGIAVQFSIPTDQPQTSLATQPPTYWEIEVRGRAPGADLEAYFLVPVYRLL